MNITVHRGCPPNHDKDLWRDDVGYMRAEDDDVVVILPASLSMFDEPSVVKVMENRIRAFVQIEKDRAAQ